MNTLDFSISVIAVFVQFYVVWIGWKLLKIAKFLDSWKIGWYHFVIASSVIALIRIIWSYEAYFQTSGPLYVQSVLGLVISVCLVWFVYYMRISFTNLHDENSKISRKDAAEELLIEEKAQKD